MKRKTLLGRAKNAYKAPGMRPLRSKVVMGVLIAGCIGAYTAAAALSWWKRLDPRNW